MTSRTAVCLSLLLLLVPSCQPEEKKPLPPVPQAATSGGSAGQATVTLSEGQVEARLGTQWLPLETGSLVDEKAEVRTGKNAYVDLSFGQFGTLHLGERTVVALRNLRLSDQKNTVDMELLSGRVIATVRKLVGNDRFQVSTNTVAAGVRGTRFLVSKTAEDSTMVAVEEGYVALLPPELISLETSPQDPTTQALLEQLSEQIALASPLIRAGEQSLVTQETMAGAQKALATVGAAVTAGKLGSQDDRESLVEQYQNQLKAAPLPRSEPLKESSRRVFEAKPGADLEPQEDPVPGAAFGPSTPSQSADPAPPAWLRNPTQAAWLVLNRDQDGRGLTMVSQSQEGSLTPNKIAGKMAWTTDGVNQVNSQYATYVYFSLSDPRFANGATPRCVITIEYRDDAPSGSTPEITLEYDSQGKHLEEGWLAAFEPHPQPLVLGSTRTWRTHSWTLDDALFSGGTNRNDFRLVLPPGLRLTLASAAVAISP